MNCVNCGEKMTHRVAGVKNDHLAFEICESCGGLWLDKGELDKMAFQVPGSIEYSSEKLAEEVDEPVKFCPRCKGLGLSKVYFLSYSDIVLDHCRNCDGFWLDAGELGQINKELEDIMPVTGKGFTDFIKNVHQPLYGKKNKARTDFVPDDVILKVPPIKGAKKLEETEIDCPVCKPKTRMELFELHNLKFEGCPKCKGIFLDQGELRKLKDKSKQESWLKLNWVDDEIEGIESSIAIDSNRFCPKCREVKMICAHYGQSNILMDWCPRCRGIWLDYNEFQEIIEYLKDKLTRMSSKEMKEKLKEEIREIWGGPEGTWDEIKDAKAALSAFLAITVFEHPKLCRIMYNFSKTLHHMGIY